MDNSYDMDLYILCCTKDNEYETQLVDEMGWVSDKEFLVWVSYLWLKEFIEQMTKIFGYGLFDDGGFTSHMQTDGICFDLTEAVGDYMDIESLFPKDKYQH